MGRVSLLQATMATPKPAGAEGPGQPLLPGAPPHHPLLVCAAHPRALAARSLQEPRAMMQVHPLSEAT